MSCVANVVSYTLFESAATTMSSSVAMCISTRKRSEHSFLRRAKNIVLSERSVQYFSVQKIGRATFVVSPDQDDP